ncbi:hypothetical protein DFH06DRAFT_1390388 [Mycena polygramma]|nr:hypothetical protein DFH06DRAFT_1390388 [Mycena polygramma]
MGCIRPATPGFVLTTLATALLAVVSFCVPYFKSVFFLKAVITVSGVSGSITFGTLGYCIELNNGTTCSKPSVGYELDINSLVGNNLPIEIPNVVVKWLTYVLVLHIVALALAAGSALFGLLAHVREMSMTCCSTCVSGFAAAVALLAFIFDLAFFFIAKSRINAVGSASIGNAIWLTLAAWILLFFSGCFYTLGRCCISKRSKRGDWDRRQQAPPPDGGDQLRLDAIKAEADRKARQKASEGGLPPFHERQPLTSTAYDDGSNVYSDKPYTPGGYVPAPQGARAVDQYYNGATSDPFAAPAFNNNAASSATAYNNGAPSAAAGYAAGYHNASTAYPPSPQRQPSAYAASTYSYNAHQQQQQYQSTPPPLPQTMSPPPQQYHSSPPPQQQQANPYLGHGQGGTSYHSAATHHGGEYSQYDPYDDAGAGAGGQAESQYYTPQSQYPQSHPQSMYAGQQGQTQTQTHDGYGANSVPPLSGYFGQHAEAQQSSASSSSGTPASPTSPKGPRNHRQSLYAMNHTEEDSPPQYEAGGASEHVPGAWGKS